ncbi:hypothetical protein [Spirosoma linguale]|jgi:predicted tellurium resistance membrane protein TerC|uniref:Uncharacterized protein n=1 Tax=Spirosoma linguale (strain ATCC 33905 / DSM 74 / LMG 10896 / Claus 1) TaxID=504472 RepID=D2QVN1_SPILD|nr:hypothetical protein Slin_6917 [Spirosoma linguale DSM 74]
MKKSVIFTTTALLCLVSMNLLAQPGSSGEVSQALTGYYNTIVTIGNVIFGILMVIGVVKVVSAFISNSPNSVRNLLYLVVGAIIWFGFNLIVNDVQTTSGGSTGGYTLTR